MAKISSAELEGFEIDDSIVVPPPDIVAYNELRSCADLVRMYREGILNIQPDFQRDVVWSPPAKTRFIDSLIKQLPIPSMCFSLDYKTQKWQVIDGLQRLSSIIDFLNLDSEWTLSKLKDVDPLLSGVKVEEFRKPDSPLKTYLQRVENMSIPITVLRCDYSKPDHTSYLFTVFHRLNTGGVRLNNQEIRNCIYQGSFNDLLKMLNKNKDWISITKQSKSSRTRYVWIEQILRFFGFMERLDKYSGSLSGFLNDYMADLRNISTDISDQKTETFIRTVRIVQKIKQELADSQWSRTILEAVMHGVGTNVSLLETVKTEELLKRLEKLRDSPSFSSGELKDDLSRKDKVENRLNDAQRIFSGN